MIENKYFILDSKMDSEQVNEKIPITSAEVTPAVEPVQSTESKPNLKQIVTQDFKQNKEINTARIIILVLLTLEIVCKLNMKIK